MRSFDEVKADVAKALSVRDAVAIRSMAGELEDHLGTEAEALRASAMGTMYWLTGDFSDALQHYERARSLYDELGEEKAAASVRQNLGTVHLSVGEYAKALDHYEQALAQLEAMGETKSSVSVLNNIGLVHFSTGDHANALELFRRVQALHEEFGNEIGAAKVTGNIGNVYYITGDYPRALQSYEQALALHLKNGDRSLVATTTSNIGLVYDHTGDYPRALELLERALGIHNELGNRAGVALVTANIGNVYEHTGDFTQALDHYERALAMHESTGGIAGIALATGNIGNICAATGNFERARECFDRAIELFNELGDAEAVARMTGNLCELLMRQEDYHGARELLSRQEEMSMTAPGTQISYFQHRSQIKERDGLLDAAKESLRSAMQVAEQAGRRDKQSEIHLTLRDLAKKLGDFEDYIHHNDEYLRINEEIRGKDATQKLAMLTAERKMEAERQERERERAVLYSALPKHIADRVVRGEDVSGDHFKDAAVLFLDVVGFTTHSSQLPAQSVTKLLGEIFHHFDEICARHDIVKVKTIGDSYMAAALDHGPQNAERLARAALDIAASPFTWPELGDAVQFRVGLHSGPVVAGVLGKQRLQYDVWGDTVNVASRMESTGEPGRIQVSEAFAKNLKGPEGTGRDVEGPEGTGRDLKGPEGTGRDLKDGLQTASYRLLERGAVEVKGKGKMNTYWLEQA